MSTPWTAPQGVKILTAAIGRNVGHAGITLTVQTEFLPVPLPRLYPINLTVDARTTHRFRVTVVHETHLHEPAGRLTRAHFHDLTRILWSPRGISNKGQHGRAENSSRNNKFRSRFDAIEPAHF